MKLFESPSLLLSLLSHTFPPLHPPHILCLPPRTHPQFTATPIHYSVLIAPPTTSPQFSLPICPAFTSHTSSHILITHPPFLYYPSPHVTYSPHSSTTFTYFSLTASSDYPPLLTFTCLLALPYSPLHFPVLLLISLTNPLPLHLQTPPTKKDFQGYFSLGKSYMLVFLMN